MQISGYKLLNTIGQGGMATVYEAIQTSLNRKVAIKILSPTLVMDPEFCKRFLKEGKILAQLSHPNIITIHDIGDIDGSYFMSMEYLENGNLRTRIDEGLTEKEAIDIILQVATALGYAHDRGFLHRDVKPLNVLFRADDTAVLTDFGIAKSLSDHQDLTSTGKTIGSPLYMSPEQIRGEPLDIRSDLYSLGVLMYQMLTGYAPYLATTADSTTRMHLSCPLPRLPEHLDHYQPIIRRLLAKARNNRFLNSWELIDALETIQQQRQATIDRTGRINSQPAASAFARDEDAPTLEVSRPAEYHEVPTIKPEPVENTVPLEAKREPISPAELAETELEKTQELVAAAAVTAKAPDRRYHMAAGFAAIAALLGLLLLPELLSQKSDGQHSEPAQLAEQQPPTAEPAIAEAPAEKPAEPVSEGLLIALNDPPEEAVVETDPAAEATEASGQAAVEEGDQPAVDPDSLAAKQIAAAQEAVTQAPVVAEQPAEKPAEAEAVVTALPSLEQRADAAKIPSLEERAAAAKEVVAAVAQKPEGVVVPAAVKSAVAVTPSAVKPLEQVALVSADKLQQITEEPAAFVKPTSAEDLTTSANAQFLSLKDPGIMSEGAGYQINYELESALRQVSSQVYRNANGSVSVMIDQEALFSPETDQLEQNGVRSLDRLAYIFRNYSGFGIHVEADRLAEFQNGVLDISRMRAERVSQYFLSNLIEPGRISVSMRSGIGSNNGNISFLLQPSI